jgi:hypothetical protein
LDFSSVQTKVFNKFHISVLEQYVTPTDGRNLARSPAIILESDSQEVDCILRKHVYRNMEQLLVRCKGYSDEECTWQPLADFEDAKEALQKMDGKVAKRAFNIEFGKKTATTQETNPIRRGVQTVILCKQCIICHPAIN